MIGWKTGTGADVYRSGSTAMRMSGPNNKHRTAAPSSNIDAAIARLRCHLACQISAASPYTMHCERFPRSLTDTPPLLNESAETTASIGTSSTPFRPQPLGGRDLLLT